MIVNTMHQQRNRKQATDATARTYNPYRSRSAGKVLTERDDLKEPS